MHYKGTALVLTDNRVSDSGRAVGLDDLPDPQPLCQVRLVDTTPLMERLWRIALSDIESNIVQVEGKRFFGAGEQFGFTVFTRDISYAGVLGLNALYPEVMLSSMRYCRELRRRVGFRLSQPYVLDAIKAPWIRTPFKTEGELQKKYGTASIARRTDDVVWMWCAADLIEQHEMNEEWPWFYQTGCDFFNEFYAPFFDEADGLYHGQASFIDIHYVPHGKATGYPDNWSAQDCILIKSLSTNCLYFMALQAMARAAEHLGKNSEAAVWRDRAENVKQAIRRELRHEDGYLAYYKDKHGVLTDRREALGSALAVLCGIVSGSETELALGGYPVTDCGAPLFHPFFDSGRWYHNNSSWPFVDTFFLQAMDKADGRRRDAFNAALLARSCTGAGTFHEVVDYRTGEPKGSKRQLWTAASFVDVCRRAGLQLQPPPPKP